MQEQGSLSIESENMFPIIKKWLYSDHDIFVRELVSNGADAITKRKKLDALGEAELPDGYKPSIHVLVDDKSKTLKFIDNGIGMTADEVKEYINQVAFSGASEFLNKYKDKGDSDQIIGHFGLGFYSAFMVADTVTIDTLSYKEGAVPVHWVSEGGINFEMSDGDRKEPGTTITLEISDDSIEFANEYRVKEVLEKYCSFMPYEIFVEKEGAPQEYETIDEEDLKDTDVVVEHIVEPAKTEEKTKEDGSKETVTVTPEKKKVKINKRPVPVNDIHPLWMKQPQDCTEDEYKDFYRKVFHDYREPLFWIHLNMDYPFNLKGIIYFPKVNPQYENIEGTIKLYNTQVFIADNIKEVIPEFLLVLKGVIDCPDLPLNVSRSALQNDGFVKKISDYITKKVADKLIGMYKTRRDDYNKYWDDISPFIKYGCLRDEKFRDKMKEYIIFKNLDGKYISLPQYILAGAKQAPAEEDQHDSDNNEEKSEPPYIVYYVTDLQQQGQYVKMFKDEGMDALIMGNTIDQPFISQLEAFDIDVDFPAENESGNTEPVSAGADKEAAEASDADGKPADEGKADSNDSAEKKEVKTEKKKVKVKFQRIDSKVDDQVTSEADKKTLEDDTKKLADIFKKALDRNNLTVEAKSLKDEKVSSIMTLSEDSRRMEDMMRMYSMESGNADPGSYRGQETLVLNINNKLVRFILDNPEGDDTKLICEQLYDLAAIANRPLSADEMAKFVERTNDIMIRLAD
ncbi:MAG: molecular chaperone HtpG [Lachnospiraceae bacterium]|jgi:molecular chaperone HtpG|nr:molecular chaperone HtpG [Lachnospiraceae bacterium]MEE3461696.1 molecular chaperone HtpG [Lachnospiraceae bacterium]